MKNNWLTKQLKGANILLVFAFIASLFTSPIIRDVLIKISYEETITPEQIEWWYAFSKALFLEFLIVVLLANGKKKTSIAFTMTTGFVSLFYYNNFAFDQWALNTMQVVYSFMFPIVTAITSHIYIYRVEKEQQDQAENEQIESEKIGKLQQENRIKTEQIDRLSEINGKQIEELNQKENDIQLVHETLEEVHSQSETIRKINRKQEKELKRKSEQEKKLSEKLRNLSIDAQKWKSATTCKHCGTSVSGPQGLGMHESKCAKNPKNMKKNVEQLEIKQS